MTHFTMDLFSDSMEAVQVVQERVYACCLLYCTARSDAPKEADTDAHRQGSSRLSLCFGLLFLILDRSGRNHSSYDLVSCSWSKSPLNYCLIPCEQHHVDPKMWLMTLEKL